ncbi:DUF5957 family protein [Actinomycetes bacterium KLBMP 9759]
MRMLGIAVLGLFSGLLLGFFLTEVVAVAAGAASGRLPDAPWLLLLLGWLTPGCAVAGVLVAITIDRKRRAR